MNVYDVPFDNPSNTPDVTAPNDFVTPPGDAVTVYPVTGAPPEFPGAVHDTDTWPSPGVPDAPVGAPGAVAAGAVGTTAFDTVDAGPRPTAFRARTVNV